MLNISNINLLKNSISFANTIGAIIYPTAKLFKSITIPASCKKIGRASAKENVYAGVFSFCAKLSNVTIQNGTEEIGNCAFSDCPKLTVITIPKTVKKIGLKAFGYNDT